MGWTPIRSPKFAVFGIALMLFAIILALTSSGAGLIILGLGVIGLILVAIA